MLTHTNKHLHYKTCLCLHRFALLSAAQLKRDGGLGPPDTAEMRFGTEKGTDGEHSWLNVLVPHKINDGKFCRRPASLALASCRPGSQPPSHIRPELVIDDNLGCWIDIPETK